MGRGRELVALLSPPRLIPSHGYAEVILILDFPLLAGVER